MLYGKTWFTRICTFCTPRIKTRDDVYVIVKGNSLFESNETEKALNALFNKEQIPIVVQRSLRQLGVTVPRFKKFELQADSNELARFKTDIIDLKPKIGPPSGE